MDQTEKAQEFRMLAEFAYHRGQNSRGRFLYTALTGRLWAAQSRSSDRCPPPSGSSLRQHPSHLHDTVASGSLINPTVYNIVVLAWDGYPYLATSVVGY